MLDSICSNLSAVYHLINGLSPVPSPKLAFLFSPLAAHSLDYLYLKTQGQYWLYSGIVDN